MKRPFRISIATLLSVVAVGMATLTSALPAQSQAAPVKRVKLNGTIYRPLADVPAPPVVRAKAWAVVDLTTGHVLGKHRLRATLPQASTIKLLTALTATHRVSATTPVRATRLAAGTICSCAGVRAGRRYTRDMLLAGMLVKSGNDAAEALAGGDPRGRSRFISAMNKTAERLGASDTVARNPSGLDQAGAHSSARDLLTFLREAAGRPAISGWLDTPSTRFGALKGPRHRLESTTDYMLMYPESYAAKNGYTTRARNTLVAATVLDERNIGVAILGAEAGYTTSGARRLTKWAAANVDYLAAVGSLPAD